VESCARMLPRSSKLQARCASSTLRHAHQLGGVWLPVGVLHAYAAGYGKMYAARQSARARHASVH
jgi:hypothetical protein